MIVKGGGYQGSLRLFFFFVTIERKCIMSKIQLRRLIEW